MSDFLTSSTLRSRIPALVFIAADKTYARVTKRWLVEDFYPWFVKSRSSLGLGVYSTKNDCDNFTRAYAQAAQDCHSLTITDKDAEAVAVGEYFYHSIRGPHAIAVAITDAGITFIEPQTGQPIEVTPAEQATCYYARF